MEIEPGSEWFHRDSLRVLSHVQHNPSRDGFDVIDGFLTGTIPYEDFLRDYARNEPVSPEVVWGMGWTGQEGDLRAVRRLSGNGFNFELWWKEGAAESFEIEQNGETIFPPFPATLRDLLNVLRVFGVPVTLPSGTPAGA